MVETPKRPIDTPVSKHLDYSKLKNHVDDHPIPSNEHYHALKEKWLDNLENNWVSYTWELVYK